MKKIGITLGDPGGIGPEIVFKTITPSLLKETCLIVFGSKTIIRHPAIKPLITAIPIVFLSSDIEKAREILTLYSQTNPASPCLFFVDCFELDDSFVIGAPHAENGKASFSYLDTALSFIKNGLMDAITTAPICKESFHLAQIPYKDHTTLLQASTQSPEVSMAFYTPKLKTILATIHCPLSEVSGKLTRDLLSVKLRHALVFATLCRISNPKIAIPGLNPHAGENGLFGKEEQKILIPFIQEQQSLGVPIFGPIPADTLYYRAYQGEFDIIISLYHDQALIPIKLLHFFDAVNITLGLPFLRTSPDHGTAFEIAYQNKANPDSFKAALEFNKGSIS